MRYGVLGATGPTGKQILHRLRGKKISVFVRNPSKLPFTEEVEVVPGSLQDEAKLREWASRQDVVFCTLGHGLTLSQTLSNLGLGHYPQKDMMTRAMQVVISAKPKRIVHCSAYGTRETRGDLPFVFGKILLPVLIAASYADHENVENLLGKSSLEWVIARPGMLTHGPAKGGYRKVDRFPPGKTVQISRADVADFMVQAAESSEYLRRCVGLGY